MKAKKIKLADTVGNTRGRNADKNHRVAKLMRDWDTLHEKMEGMVARGRAKTDASLCAFGVLLIMETGIRVGNEESAEGFTSVGQRVAQKDDPEKGVKKGDVIWQSATHGQTCRTFGLTTLRNEHVKVMKNRKTKESELLTLNFIGKKHVEQLLATADPTLLRYAPRRTGDAAGSPDAVWLGITDNMLRKFVRRYVGKCFTPKDIRRAYVNRIFLTNFVPARSGPFVEATKKSERNAIIREAIEETAETVGHTAGVCRSAYLSHLMLNTLKNWTPESGRIV